MGKEHLYELEFSPADMSAIPALHRQFFIFTCFAANDIRFFLNLTIMALQAADQSRDQDCIMIERCAASNVLICHRIFASKVFEYIKLLQDYRKKCVRKKDATTHQFIETANSKLSPLISIDRVEYKFALWLRDNITNHYLQNDIIKSYDEFLRENPEENFHIYLHEFNGNTFYPLGDQTLTPKFAEISSDARQGFTKFDLWIRETAETLMSIHQDFCETALTVWLPDKKAVEKPLPDQHPTFADPNNTMIPLFWMFPDPESGLLESPTNAERLERAISELDNDTSSRPDN